MKIDVEDIKEHLRYRKIVNRANLHAIEWYENGKRLDIHKGVLDYFELTGLNNIDFIATGFYTNVEIKNIV